VDKTILVWIRPKNFVISPRGTANSPSAWATRRYGYARAAQFAVDMGLRWRPADCAQPNDAFGMPGSTGIR
jgi:hypothetical protein